VAAPELIDSRRLTGPNLISASPGAVIDVSLGGLSAKRVIEVWREQSRRILEAVGWSDAELATRDFPGGASLMMSAPIDALYAATEVNEWAWSATQAQLAGSPEPDLDEGAERLRQVMAEEQNPRLIALQEAAAERGVCFLSDDDLVSVGMGSGSITWPVDELPNPSEVAWNDVHNVPVALITGSNGKTTTVRLLAAIATAQRHSPGYTSTDGIYVDGQLVDADDWSGPGGARRVLRDKRVDIAILETARGGMLRRGLAVQRADAAIVTNVAADHLGEFGVHDVEGVAEAKLVVSRAIESGNNLVLNAEDPAVVSLASRLGLRPTWFAINPNSAPTRAHIDGGGEACFVEDGWFVAIKAGKRAQLVPVADAPLTFEGSSRYNISNALGAIAVARALDISDNAIRAGLYAFGETPDQNPGRANFFELGGARVIVDFAHNPHGLEAFIEMASAMSAERRLLILGQAGDRDDESIRELALVAARHSLDRIIIKELQKYLRGREEGEVPGLLETTLREAGMSGETLVQSTDEMQAVRDALEWARPDDLLLLPLHTHRDEVLDLLSSLVERGWHPGEELPL